MPSRFRLWLEESLTDFHDALRKGQVPPQLYFATLERMESYFKIAREGMVAALKASGERFADLRELDLEDLSHDYVIYRKQYDAQRETQSYRDLVARRRN